MHIFAVRVIVGVVAIPALCTSGLGVGMMDKLEVSIFMVLIPLTIQANHRKVSQSVRRTYHKSAAAKV